jgi:hypothetical protein
VTPSTALVVTKINGVDAVTYVRNWIYQALLNQDADAAYNSMFFKKAFNASGIGDGYFSSGGRARYITRWPTRAINSNINTADTYTLAPIPRSRLQMEL